MAETERSCPKCRAVMQEGFIPVSIGPPPAVASVWLAGAPEKSWLGGIKVDKNEWHGRLQIQSYRCSGCGYLEQYATRP